MSKSRLEQYIKLILKEAEMKRHIVSLLLIIYFIGIIVAVSGCCICWSWGGQERYERTESLSAPMAGLERISVDTSFGDVKINGADTADCSVVAKITGNAPTTEEAKQLAEQTQIKLETEGNTLVIRAEKPNLKHNRSIGVAYDITVPTKTSVNCRTSFGAVELANIEGDIDTHTSFGEIDIEKISGKILLDTSYGDVDCKQIVSPDFSAKTSFGKIDIEFSDACPADLKAKIETSYGDVKVDLPSAFAGRVSAETSFGKIKTDLPVLVKGAFGKDHLEGTIGQPALSGVEGGTGSLDLKTSFGSVKIR
jgi:DUF4097 and DUF4098 domain-containing protein YvlB